MSKSEQKRREGNAIIKSLGPDLLPSEIPNGPCINLSPAVLEPRLNDAISLYRDALKLSLNNKEEILAHKNLASSYLRLLNLSRRSPERFTASQIGGYHASIVQNFCKSLRHQNLQDDDWYNDLHSKLTIFIDDAFDRITQSPQNFGLNVRICSEITRNIPDYLPHLSLQSWIGAGNFYFHHGLSLLASEGQKEAVNSFYEAQRPIEEASQKLKASYKNRPSYLVEREYEELLKNLASELNVLRSDVNMHMTIGEAQQYLARADEQRNKAIFEDECLDYNGVFVAFDMYQQTVVLCRELDLETEAVALSRMGLLHHSIFKNKHKAKPYMQKSIEIAMSMTPRNFGTTKWFVDAQKVLSQYQSEKVVQEETKIADARNKFQLENAAALQQIQSFERADKFLEFIYESYPMKDKNGKIQKMNMELTRKKRTLQALLHYHTDKFKQNSDDEYPKMYFICEAITKELNGFYAYMKAEE